MKQLVEYIVSNLVNHPEDVIIEEEKTPDGETELSNISIQVNPEDVGRVIGRSGKVINALRQIVRIAAIQKGIRVRVDLKDDGPKEEAKPAPETPETPVETPETPEVVVEGKPVVEKKEEKLPKEEVEEAPTL